MIQELRIYQVASAEGFDAYAEAFSRFAKPCFEERGCEVAGVWRAEVDPPPFAFMLGFRDRDHRRDSYEKVLADDRMLSEYLPRRAQAIDASVPDQAWVLDAVPEVPFRREAHPCYEMRMYTPHPGRMADYASVFASDVAPMFERLGAPVLGGWAGTRMSQNPYEEEPGAPAPFAYLLAYPDRARRDEVFGPKLLEQPEMAGYLPKRAELIDSEVPTLNWIMEPVSAA